MSNNEQHEVLDLMYPHPLKKMKTESIDSGRNNFV